MNLHVHVHVCTCVGVDALYNNMYTHTHDTTHELEMDKCNQNKGKESTSNTTTYHSLYNLHTKGKQREWKVSTIVKESCPAITTDKHVVRLLQRNGSFICILSSVPKVGRGRK